MGGIPSFSKVFILFAATLLISLHPLESRTNSAPKDFHPRRVNYPFNGPIVAAARGIIEVSVPGDDKIEGIQAGYKTVVPHESKIEDLPRWNFASQNFGGREDRR